MIVAIALPAPGLENSSRHQDTCRHALTGNQPPNYPALAYRGSTRPTASRHVPKAASVMTSIARFLMASNPTSLAGSSSLATAAANSAAPPTTPPTPPPAEPWRQAMYTPRATMSRTASSGMTPTVLASSLARLADSLACLADALVPLKAGAGCTAAPQLPVRAHEGSSPRGTPIGPERPDAVAVSAIGPERPDIGGYEGSSPRGTPVGPERPDTMAVSAIGPERPDIGGYEGASPRGATVRACCMAGVGIVSRGTPGEG